MSELNVFHFVKCFGSFAEAFNAVKAMSWSLASSWPFCFLCKEAERLSEVPSRGELERLSKSLLRKFEARGEENPWLTPWWGVEEGDGFWFRTTSGTNGVEITPNPYGGVVCEYSVRSAHALSQSSAARSFLAAGWGCLNADDSALRYFFPEEKYDFPEEYEVLPKVEHMGRGWRLA